MREQHWTGQLIQPGDGSSLSPGLQAEVEIFQSSTETVVLVATRLEKRLRLVIRLVIFLGQDEAGNNHLYLEKWTSEPGQAGLAKQRPESLGMIRELGIDQGVGSG